MEIKLFTSARGTGFLQGTVKQFKQAATNSFPRCMFDEVEDGAINVFQHGDLVREFYIYDAIIQPIGDQLPDEGD